MKSTKAQGISVNTIIIAAIALIVLVVLIAVFGGRMGLWGEGMDKATEGTKCTDVGSWKSECETGEEAAYGKFEDADKYPGLFCCVGTSETNTNDQCTKIVSDNLARCEEFDCGYNEGDDHCS